MKSIRWSGKRGAFRVTLFLSLSLSASFATAAFGETPLLMDGKKTLYQRVLTRPGAELASTAGAKGNAIPALSQFYVYERKDVGGAEWLGVGAGARGRGGWVAAQATLPWKQQLTLEFTNPTGRDRTLLFAKRDPLVELLDASDGAAQVQSLRKVVESGGRDPRVVSIEPETHIDIDEQFYLLPILQAEQRDLSGGHKVRVLEVASVSATDSPRDGAGSSTGSPATDEPLRSFSAALVFVVDSTVSMGPYIDRTREAVQKIYDRIEAAGLARKVRFGLVAYRSSTDAVAGLEYVTKVYADPNEVKSGDDFLARVQGLEPAPISTPSFDEDAFSGLLAAKNQIDWSRFGGRYVVLITDAGAIEAESSLSGTGLGAEQVRLELADDDMALYVLHLKTPEGRRNHRSAERQYKQVSQNDIVGRPLYYDVDAGSVEVFGTRIETLADGLIAQVKGAAKGEAVPGSVRTTAKPRKPKSEEDVASRLDEELQLLGRAMQLAYLGRVQGTTAPPLFRAWLSDRDLTDPARATTQVRVLLTKNQLSDLAQVLGAILEAGERSQQTSSSDFFESLRSAAASLARDPTRLTESASSRLGEMGLLGEYLDDLPYKSNVMSLTPEVWAAWSVSQQEDLLDSLRRKLRHYRLYDGDTERWISLTPGAPAGESVYPVPLDALP